MDSDENEDEEKMDDSVQKRLARRYLICLNSIVLSTYHRFCDKEALDFWRMDSCHASADVCAGRAPLTTLLVASFEGYLLHQPQSVFSRG
jgi:hypothetical protein